MQSRSQSSIEIKRIRSMSGARLDRKLWRSRPRVSDNKISALLDEGFLGGRWNFLNSFGLWIYSPFMGGYSFMPFGYGWCSPYGMATEAGWAGGGR
jgi:hypothetical protein